LALRSGWFGVIGVGDPVGGFGGVPGAIAFGRGGVTFLTVTREKLTQKSGLLSRAGRSRQNSWVRRGWFFSAPNVLRIQGRLAAGPDAFAPFIIATEQAAETHHAGSEISGGIDESLRQSSRA